MNEEAFNVSMRILKKVGITSQREIEAAVPAALASGKLEGHEALPAKVILTVGASGLRLRSTARSSWNKRAIVGSCASVVVNYCFPKTWPADREQRARIIGDCRRNRSR
jgi:Family of unknown function (DUF6494)